MRLTALQYFLWYLSFAAQLAFALLMIYKRAVRRWPVLFTLAAFEVTLTIILMNLTGRAHYPQYRHTYWTGEIIRAFLEYALIFEILAALPGIRFIPKHLAIVFVSSATVMAAGCAWMASHGGVHTFRNTDMALRMDRCLSVATAVFALFLFKMIWRCGLRWTEVPLRLATGFVSLTLMSTIDAYAMSAYPSSARTIHRVADLLEIGVWLFWTTAIMRDRRYDPQNAESETSSIPFPNPQFAEKGTRYARLVPNPHPAPWLYNGLRRKVHLELATLETPAPFRTHRQATSPRIGCD